MNKSSKIGTIVGVTLTPFLAILALFSAGAGHGDYFLARIFYPLPMLILMSGAGGFIIPLVLLQYPFFGWLIGHCISRKQFIRLALILVLLQFFPMVFVLRENWGR